MWAAWRRGWVVGACARAAARWPQSHRAPGGTKGLTIEHLPCWGNKKPVGRLTPATGRGVPMPAGSPRLWVAVPCARWGETPGLSLLPTGRIRGERGGHDRLSSKRRAQVPGGDDRPASGGGMIPPLGGGVKGPVCLAGPPPLAACLPVGVEDLEQEVGGGAVPAVALGVEQGRALVAQREECGGVAACERGVEQGCLRW